MAAVTVGEVLERLEASGILDEAVLEAVRGKAGEPDADAEPFVKRLHKDGDLTGYQAKAIWKGKGHKLVIGNYVVEDELGRGGMGVVLRARHKRMQRTVGIKVLPAKMTEDADAIARFHREVVAASQLLHPNIVSAFDADEVDGQQILVMEFVDGRDLSAVVKTEGPLGVEQALDCVIQTARGLEFAHKRGVIHRDIKPANLLLDVEGTVKILDMGLARFSDAADVGTQAELTGTGTIMGTVDYMSPEQAMSTKSADARADQYSLGITLYYLLTGNPAYTGETLMARLMAHANNPIPSLADERPDVPPGLQEVFATMVAKDPEGRYPSMTEAIAALEACRSDGSATGIVAKAPVTGDESAGGLSKVLNADSIVADPDVTSPLEGNATAADGERVATSTKKKTRREKKPAPAAEATMIGDVDIDTSRTVRTASPPTTEARGTKPPWTDWRVLTGAGGAALLLLAVVFFFRGPNGSTLRVEIDDPTIEVSVKGTEIVLKGADAKGKDITLEPGEHTLHVTRGDFEFDTDTLILKQGETVVVKVERLDGEVRVVRGETVIGSSSETPGESVVGDGPGELAAAKPGANNALAFDGKASATVTFPAPVAVDEFTVEAFVTTDQRTAYYSNIAADRNLFRLTIFLHWAFGPTAAHNAGGAMYEGDKLPVGRTAHVAGVYHAGEYLLFVDGELLARSKMPLPANGELTQLVFGNAGFEGTLDEVRLSTVARYTDDFTPPKPHQQYTPDPNTLALYQFDEGSGDVLKDVSGNGHHGKIVGATWVKVGDTKTSVTVPTVAGANNALAFEDENTVVQCPEVVVDPHGPYTLEAWVLDENGRGNLLYLRSGGFPRVIAGGPRHGMAFDVAGFKGVGVGKEPVPERGRWTHVAGVYADGQVRLFVDGKLLGTKAIPPTDEAKPSKDLWIGGRVHGSNNFGSFQGRIDEVRISKTARYDEDFAPARGFATDADTLALYHCDEGTGDVLNDSSGNGHHGKITGAEWVRVEGSGNASSLNFGLSFDAPGARVQVADFPVKARRPVTIEAWVTQEGDIQQGATLIDWYGGDRLQLAMSETNLFITQYKTKSSSTYNKRLARRRVHVAGTSDGERTRLFVDGRLVDNHWKPKVGTGPTPTRTFFVGGRPPTPTAPDADPGEQQGSWASFPGVVHQVRVTDGLAYEADFTPAERLTATDETLAIYNFDEGRGDVAKDSSGNGHHGKITGAKWVRAEEVTERMFAERILSLADGKLATDVEGVPVRYTSASELPDEPFHVLWVASSSVMDAEMPLFRVARQLEFLALTGSQVTDQGLAPLVALPRLTTIHLQRTRVTDAGLSQLANSKSLVEIRIFGTAITDAGLKHLERMKQLRVLNVSNTAVTATGVARLQQALPDCEITSSVAAVPPDATGAASAPPPAVAPFDATTAKAHQEAWAKQLGVAVVTTNSIGMQFAVIPPGKFVMGSPASGEKHRSNEAQVDVTLTKPFRLGVHEVTQGQWKAVMATEPWREQQYVEEGTNVAASYISWNDATEFCKKLNELERASGSLENGWEYRLPTGAEWEYACRSGTTTEFVFGDGFGDGFRELSEHAWFTHNTQADPERHPHEVGVKRVSPWRLHDMHGNTWEWCRDRYGEKLLGGPNPQGPDRGAERVRRGGGFKTTPSYCRSATRVGAPPTEAGHGTGFRPVLGRERPETGRPSN